MSVVIGVDGGGTKTLTVCIDVATGKVLAQEETGSTNSNSVGNDTAKTNLLDGLKKVVESAKVSTDKVVGVCLGMSGVDRPADKLKVVGWITSYFDHLKHSYSTGEESDAQLTNSNILVYNDAVAALASGTQGHLYGIVVISGTGTITVGYASDNVSSTRSAGWGPLLGDEGSGYSIGSDILKRVVRSCDGVEGNTLLKEAVFKELNIKSASELIPWAYKDSFAWKQFADLAPLATQCAKQGDNVAIQILENAANNLLANITTVISKLGLDKENNIPIVLSGGNLAHEGSYLADLLINKIKAKYSNANILFPQVNAAVASALLLKNRFK